MESFGANNCISGEKIENEIKIRSSGINKNKFLNLFQKHLKRSFTSSKQNHYEIHEGFRKTSNCVLSKTIDHRQ